MATKVAVPRLSRRGFAMTLMVTRIQKEVDIGSIVIMAIANALHGARSHILLRTVRSIVT